MCSFKKTLLLLLLAMGAALNAQQSIRINPNITHQTINSFSASDCWTGNYVGKWEDAVKEKAAKWLFASTLQSNGMPNGIGLSMWRINLGGGSAEQGDNSTIKDLSRRAECFLSTDGSYDWRKHEGQRYFWTKAKEYGCDNFVLFSNSPPVSFTRNGLSTSLGDWRSNLKEDCYDDFADYLSTVADYLQDQEGLPVTYISPVNEPQYQWTGGGQEGTPWTNSEIKKLAVELDKKMITKGLSSKIILSEAADWNYVLGGTKFAENQIHHLFNPLSLNYVGGLASVEKAIAGHSYWTDKQNVSMRELREKVAQRCKEYGVECFQSEWSMLSEPPIDGFPGSYGEASYMDIALNMAKVIHADLVHTNVVSWSFWTSMDLERWGHKNRFSLLKIVPAGGDEGDIRNLGNITPHKTLWALGNYSLFIRPGFRRIQLDGAADMDLLMGSAYLSPDSTSIVAVYVNMTRQAIPIATSFDALDGFTVDNQSIYRTCSIADLNCVSNRKSYREGELFSIPARSVITFVFRLKRSVATGNKEQRKERWAFYPNPVVRGDRLYLALDEAESDVSFSLFSFSGKLLFNSLLSSSERSVRIPYDLTANSCIVHLGTRTKHRVEKLFIR